MDEAFIRKAVDCVNAHLSDCDFEHAQFMAEMGMARTTLADKLKLLTGLTPLHLSAMSVCKRLVG